MKKMCFTRCSGSHDRAVDRMRRQQKLQRGKGNEGRQRQDHLYRIY